MDSNLTLLILGGSHMLDTGISLSHSLGFSLLSINNSLLRSKIICNNSANFTLNSITQVRMHGVVFHGCGGNTVQSVSQLTIENSTFCGTNNSKTSLIIIESKANLTTTTFLSNEIGTYSSILTNIRNYPGTFNSVSLGGALIVTHSILVLIHCHFENNKANIGGSIYAEAQSNITINNSTFIANKATGNSLGFGGALFTDESCYVIVRNGTFANNTAEQYGGIAAIVSNPVSFSRKGIYHNMLTDSDYYHNGNGLQSNFVLETTTVYNNQANTDGGAVYLLGTSIIVRNNCNFSYNVANGMGGAITANSSGLIITGNSTFTFNSAASGGGVVSIKHNSTLFIDKCKFQQNSVLYGKGGVVYAEYSDTVQHGGKNVHNLTTCTYTNKVTFAGAPTWNTVTIIILGSIFESNTAKFGGVISAIKGACIRVTNSTFEHNVVVTDGGSVFLDEGSTVVIKNASFNFNKASEQGGVIEARNRSLVVIKNSTFNHNEADIYGGVIHVKDDSYAFVNDSGFDQNFAAIDGGVFNSYTSCIIKVYRSTFVNNTAKINGGVSSSKLSSYFYSINNTFNNSNAYVIGGVINAEDNTTITIERCLFFNSLADNGGGIYAVRDSMVSVYQSIFQNNTALTDGATLSARTQSTIRIRGGAFLNNKAFNDGIIISSDRSNISIDNTTFKDNCAGHDGGAAYVYDKGNILIKSSNFNNNLAGGSGGVVYGRKNCLITIKNCSIHNSTAQSSGGVVYAQEKSNITVVASFLSNNRADYGGVVRVYVNSAINITTSTFSENHAIIEGGFSAAYKKSTILAQSSHFISNTASFGGVSIAYQSSELVFEDCIYLNNTSDYGGVIRALQKSIVMVNESMFEYNTADFGGVLCIQGSYASVWSSGVYWNSARYSGGAIYANNDSMIDVQNISFSDNLAENHGSSIVLFDSSVAIIAHSNFTKNRAHNAGGDISLQQSIASIFSSTFDLSFAEKSGGAVYMTHSNVSIDNSTFIGNSVRDKGGAVAMFSSSNLTIYHSRFINNSANSSGGAVYLEQSSRIVGVNTVFSHNRAKCEGGVISANTKSQVNITACHFNHNEAKFGAALAAVQGSSVHFISYNDSQITCGESQISCNIANKGGGIYSSDSYINFGVEININYNYANEFGGGIYAVDSSVTVTRQLNIEHNQAKYGGGISLAGSNISDASVRDNMVYINISSNQAEFGGALYVDDKHDHAVCYGNPYTGEYPIMSGCFFQKATKRLQINFNDNYANISANDLYGGLLDRCMFSNDPSTINAVDFLKKISNIRCLDTISSKPVRLCYCKNNQLDCDQQARSIKVIRGDDFKISLAAVDQVNRSISATIQSQFVNLTVPESQSVQKVSANCTDLEYQISFPSAQTKFELIGYAWGPCGNRSISKINVTITVQSCTCANGFIQADNTTKCTCICDNRYKMFSKYITECDSTTESVTRRGTFWITYLNNSDDSSPYLIYPYCPLNYCQLPSKPVFVNLNMPNGSDAQCANNRGGLLCGSCQPKFSLSIGSSKCIKCPAKWYGLPVGIIIVTIIAGIVLVVLLMLLNLTVAVGTLNSVIFYANIINANKSTYLSQSNLTIIPVFISWLNLDIGFDVCFFEGMEMYDKSWLQLVFPIYIIILVIMIICISSCSSKFSLLIGKKDPVATLATLILLSYAKLLETVIASFSFVIINYPNNSVEMRWLSDPSIYYGKWKHAFLIFIAILILLFGLPYTILLFSWQWLLRCPRSKFFSWTKNQKLHYFICAYHIPHTAKHRYWTGLLLLVRVIIYLISAFSVSVDPRIALLLTVIIICCLYLYKTVFLIRVYKNWLLNAVESIVYFNIGMLALITWYTLLDDPGNKHKEIVQTVAAYISVGTVLTLFLSIIIFHMIRYGSAKLYSFAQTSKILKKVKEMKTVHDQNRSLLSASTQDDVYNLLDVIDNSRKNRGYLPPPLCTQKAEPPTSSVVSITVHHKP